MVLDPLAGTPLPIHCGVKSTWPSVCPSQALEAEHLLGCPKWAQDVTATFLDPTPSLLGDKTVAAGTKAAQEPDPDALRVRRL